MKSNYFTKNLLPNFKTLGLLFLTVLLFSACDKDDPLSPGKKPAENLTFQKFTQPFSDDKIKATDILAKVQGEKGGYTLKEIKDITPSDVLTITGKAPNFIITINKIGTVTATIVLQHKDKKDATIAKASIEITKATAERLTFQKVSKVFTSGGSFATADILAGVQGTKTGYILKSITNITPSNVASVQGTAPAILLNMLKIGSFTATITLENPNKTDATITGAQFEITKPLTPDQVLTFNKLTKTFDSGAKFTTADILAGVQGTKDGYTLKSISTINPSGVANASGSAPNIVLNITKAGTFTATIILQHNEKADVTITNCQFEITRANAETLSFTKITKKFTSSGTIDNVKIMSHIQGNKTGYTLKSITELAPNNVARVTGTAPNLALTMTKLGAFSATITLQHNDKKDAIITGAQFELSTKTVENLTFTKRTKAFATGGSFSVADILAGVQGNKTGFTIKNITVSSNIVTVTSSKALNFGSRAGNFTATIILQHSTKADVTITNCQFEIAKLNAPTNLTFTKRTKTFTSGGSFSTTNILAGVQGTKDGYTVQNISNLSSNIVNITPTKALHFKNSVGTFTATIILEHNTKADVTITNCDFEITRANAETLSFTKITKKFTSSGTIDNAKIMSHITGDKTGYTLKSITALNPTGVASESGTVPNIYLSMTKVGTFTATITLEHSTKQDATIRNCDFELTAKTVENLTFTKRSKAFATGGKFTTAEILAGVQGNKTGYTIKNIAVSKDIVTVSSKALNFKNVAGTFTATIILQHSTKADVTIADCQFEITKRNAENLTFTKRSKPFVSGGKFSVANILAGVSGTKDGYTVKNITALNPRNLVTLTPAKALNFGSRAGAFTATIILEHNTKADVTIANCEFEISKNPAPSPALSFTKITKQYDSGNRFTTNDILGAISGSKTNYTLKSITVSPSGIAVVSGTAPNLSLTMTKAGSFTATIILEHPTKRNVSIAGAQFEITKATAETLTFQKVSEAFASGGKFSTAEIIAGVQGTKRNYTIKDITTLNPTNIVTVTSTKELSFNSRVGAFTATIILEHPAKQDVSIENCAFEITKAAAPTNLTFNKRTEPFVSGGSFTTAEILAEVSGNKANYTIKDITNFNTNIVELTPAKALNFKDVAGSFTATIILEHPTKQDVSIAGAQFEISKTAAPRLTWTEQNKLFASGGEITNADILAGLTSVNVADKGGYAIKSVAITDAAGTGATVDGAGTSAKITSYTKGGTLTLTLVFEHSTKADVTLTGKQFEITKLPAPTNLAFSKRTEPFVSGGSFTTAEILEGVQGTKDGYTVKEIANLSADIVTLTTAKKALNFKNVVGNFTATITLEHPTKLDVVFTGAQFEITKGAAERLTFQKVSKAFASGGKFSTADILGGVRGTKTGYTVKDITTLNPTNIATVSASKELDFSGNLGSFTSTIILEHPTKDDATITKAEFEVTKGAAEKLTFEKVYKPFATNGNFTTAEILAGVQGTKTGYTIKSISTISPSDVASVAGTAINMSKIGVFTATIVLQHNAKADATITGAAFQIYSDKLQVDGDGRVSLKRGTDKASITSMVIPAKMGNTNVKYINFNAFEDCTNLISVSIPNSVTSIDGSSFFNCTSLSSVIIPNSVTSIGQYAFSGCSSLSSVTIPNSVTSIERYAFYRCSSLTSVTIPSSVTSIKYRAFGRCGNLSINRPSLQITAKGTLYSILDIKGNLNILSTINGITVTSIGDSAFDGCTSLTSVTIPNSVTSIGDSAFDGCTSLTSVTIPSSVTSIGESAFDGCTSLTSVTIPSSVMSIGALVFYNCTSLTSVTIPRSITSISAGLFYNCSSLASVTIPDSVTLINVMAFFGCSKLTSVTIPSSVITIANNIFKDCSKLTHIYVATTAKKNAFETKLKMGNTAVVEVKP